ncbi:EamA family transporter [Aquimarina sp. ERC-38]|uniref:EamA family transporter n=1 Tax=Aquimarina sp. ERC-38 TaxID=2949996 RepID=UPI00224857BC|nr:EamA family transporter [Aquimarina sp. ERC-38]UZO79357.1 EamA family transporter [Aquimarina sp. ERC-38]
MIYLALSITASTVIFILFKLFHRFEVDNLQAIIFNYFIACLSGWLATDTVISLQEFPYRDWFTGAFLLGIIFITVFNLMAITTQKNGLSVAAVASKMSLAIPIIVGILLYKESTEWIKIFGIITALISVYLTAMKSKDTVQVSRKNLMYPLLVFLGSGIIDTSLKYLEYKYVSQDEVSIFSATIFGVAAFIGLLILLYKAVRKTLVIKLKNIIAGMTLGIVNYGSIYCLIRALRFEGMDSSTTFTINNVGILITSTLMGMLFFKEKLHLKNWIGIGLAIISILLVALAIK